MRLIASVVNNSARVISDSLNEEPTEVVQQSLAEITCLMPSYFLCFHDVYTPLAKIKEKYPEVKTSPDFLQQIIWALIECIKSTEVYNLSHDIESLPQVFSDIEELVKSDVSLDKRFNPIVLDALIRLGAPSSVVLLFADNSEEHMPQPLKIRADNNVDVD